MTTRTRRSGPPQGSAARELVDSGFALENADAPFLHDGLNLADIAHVLDLLRRSIIPPLTRKQPSSAGASIQRPPGSRSDRPGTLFCARMVMKDVSACGASPHSSAGAVGSCCG